MDRAGQALGEWLGEKFDWSREDREIAAFSLTLILSSAFFLTLLTLLSLAFGVVVEAFAMAVSSGVLRTFAGGAHLSTGWRCGAVSAALATFVAVAAHHGGPVIAGPASGALWAVPILIGLAVALTMSKAAPVDVPEKPITSEAQRRQLRTISTLIPAVWGIGWSAWLATSAPGSTFAGSSVHSVWLASTAGLLWETFSVVPPGIRFVRWLDGLIGRITLHK